MRKISDSYRLAADFLRARLLLLLMHPILVARVSNLPCQGFLVLGGAALDTILNFSIVVTGKLFAAKSLDRNL
jgi:hypothetical protein